MTENSTPKKKLSKSDIIRRIILVAAIIVFCYSAGMLIHIFLEYYRGDKIYKNIGDEVLSDTSTTVTIDDTEIELPFVYDHNKLLEISSNGLGYLYIPSINIRLPIAQTTDNEYYLGRTLDGTINEAGCLFVDYRIRNGLKSSNVIIYGHNRQNDSMFGKLSKYESEDFYSKDMNPLFFIYTEDKIMMYRIFSVHICEPTDAETYSFNFSDNASLQEYADKMKSLSIYDTSVDISDVSQVITLSTCTDDLSQRLVVQAKYVNEAKLP